MLFKRCVTLNGYIPKNKVFIIRNICAKASEEITQHDVKPGRKMTGWQIHSYSDGVQYSDNIKIPMIKDSNELLIKVNASSVNPIDVAMAGELIVCDIKSAQNPLYYQVDMVLRSLMLCDVVPIPSNFLLHWGEISVVRLFRKVWQFEIPFS